MLAELRAAGLRFTVEGDALRVEPRAALTDELRATIKAHKGRLLRELSAEHEARAVAIRVSIDDARLGEFRAALRAGDLHLCGNCRHFTFAANPRDAGRCSRFGEGLAPFAMPFYCSGFERSSQPLAPE